jgi:membrane protease YdiL (CAAX protease family)
MTSTRSVARRGLAIYLIAVVALSTPLQIGIIRTDAFTAVGSSIAWLTGLMLVPTIASVIARVSQSEGFADLRLRRGHHVGRALTIAVVHPFLVGALAYGAAWLPGLTRLQIPPLGMWAALFTTMLVLNTVLSTGEELGWRGYMLPHMVAAGLPSPVLVSSLVWGLWHVPLFLWGGLVQDGPHPVVTTGLMLMTTIASGYILGRLRLDSGNVWPSALLHIVWNTVIQTGFTPATSGADKALWTGETGILTVLALTVAALAYRYWRPLSDPQPEETPLGLPKVRDDAATSASPAAGSS